jgi:hypothetical protein
VVRLHPRVPVAVALRRQALHVHGSLAGREQLGRGGRPIWLDWRTSASSLRCARAPDRFRWVSFVLRESPGEKGMTTWKILRFGLLNSGGKVQILGTQTEEHGGILVWGRRRITERRVWARIGQMHARVGRSQTPGEGSHLLQTLETRRWQKDSRSQGNRLATRTVTCPS